MLVVGRTERSMAFIKEMFVIGSRLTLNSTASGHVLRSSIVKLSVSVENYIFVCDEY